MEPWDAIPRNGRAFITPIYSGTFERGGADPDKLMYKSIATWYSEFIKDLERTIDYLETREDIDTRNIAFLGLSWGAQRGAMFTSFVDRIKVSDSRCGWYRISPQFSQANGSCRASFHYSDAYAQRNP